MHSNSVRGAVPVSYPWLWLSLSFATTTVTAMDNASAADILSNIARASHLVLTTVVDHVKLIKIADISRIRLEGQLQHIALASSLTLEAVRRSSSLSNDPDIDRCLLEWLTSDEPKACLDTLQAMKSLLRDETWSRRIISMIVLVSKEDKIQEAIRLFQSQRASFHFLLATDIW
ncbi:hypothetical protein BS17DRAFT_791988 [Gyrodon lividus]|nr:hypothetical protein BS17DRAFT_791988 [Gyrodon lividus]